MASKLAIENAKLRVALTTCKDAIEKGLPEMMRLREENSRLQDETARLQQWVNDLQSGMFVNCVYCGHRYGPNKDTPVAMADVLKAHILECPQHPLSTLKKALLSLVAAKALRDTVGRTPEYEAAKEAAWKLAKEVTAVLQ